MRLVRLVLALDVLVAALVAAVVVLGAGLPLAAAGRLGPRTLVLLVGLSGAAGAGVGGVLLLRSVAGPVERLLRAAGRLRGAAGGLPVLSPDGEGDGSLSRAAIAFERVSAALTEERVQLAAKVAELEHANAALAAARESWVRAERLAAVGQLAAGLAHEVGNPLGAITGYAELARSRVPAGADPELGDALGRIAAAAARIDTTVRELLDFARPSPPTLSAVPLAPVVRSVLDLARVQPRFRGVATSVEIPDDLPPVRADPHRLAQVLLNLLLNGADATGPEGRLELTARAAGGDVEVTVADDGPGLAAEHLAEIFEPFFTTKPRGQGSGLGLAVCRTLVESFGGTLTARNGAAGGAVFTVALTAAPGRA